MTGMNLKREIDQIAKDKGIDVNEIISALEEAMKQAARRRHGLDREIEARFNDELGEIELFEFREHAIGCQWALLFLTFFQILAQSGQVLEWSAFVVSEQIFWLDGASLDQACHCESSPHGMRHRV